MAQKIWGSNIKKSSSKHWSFRSHPRTPKTKVRELIAKKAGFAGVKIGNTIHQSVEAAAIRFKQVEDIGNFVIKMGEEIVYPR